MQETLSVQIPKMEIFGLSLLKINFYWEQAHEESFERIE